MEAAAGDKEVSRPSATPEEEALKRSTDCVYFLASPLTCKKGVECEYRHSEGARVNPRDCWYWLNGNCLNLKCSFRHPPLDGLIGTVTTPSGTAPPAQPAIPTHAYSSATQNPNKQNVPCYYFQKGICLKGDRCPFVHGVSPIASPVLQQSRNFGTLATEPSQPVKKTTWSLEKCTTQNIPKETVPQPVAAADSLVRPVARADTAPGNGAILKNNVHNAQQNAELPSRLERSNAPSSGGNASTRPRDKPCQPESVDHLQNDREGDEFLRESSPGFDVLVDDEIEDAEYFHDEDKFKGTSSHGGGRRLNPVDDYDNHCDTDYYDTVDKLDREPYNEIGEYGRHAPVNDRYAREHRRASSERMLEKSSVSDRRRRREDSSSEIDGSDLRHQLKQRRLNGSRPAANSDRHELYWRDERYAEEPRYSAPVHRGDQRHASREGSISKRLQGRITLPGRNSADSKNSIHSDREIDRGRSHGRSSPGKPTNHQGRLHDRINWQKHDGFSLDENRSGSQSTRRDETGTLDFAGPKRLSELKGSKGSEQKSVGSNYSTLSREQRDMKLRKALGGHQESEPVQFEGPKPLSVILKRKREAAPENSAGFGDEGKGKDKVESPMTVAASGTQNYRSSESEGKGDQTLNNSKSFDATALDEEEEEEGLIPVDDVEQHFQSSEKDVHEMEDGTVEYDMEDPELEGYEQGDEEYYYEENEGEEYKTEDADTLYVEDEDEVQEVDDGDEFEKKLGAMLN